MRPTDTLNATADDTADDDLDLTQQLEPEPTVRAGLTTNVNAQEANATFIASKHATSAPLKSM